jgi:hypothetical protein
MHQTQRLTLAVAFLLALGGTANAASDEIIITFRSGKVQTIRIEQPGDPIEQVSFRRGKEESPTAGQPQPSAAPALKQEPAAPQPAVPAAAKSPDPAKSGDQSGAKIRWAQPADPTKY